MGKKQSGPDINRILKDEARNTESPFSSIVLKEKKEEKKQKAPLKSPKKPGEIVHGYNPSLSFADILSSYEKTGDPYRMPKKASSSSVSFGDILDEWEKGGKKTEKKKSAASSPASASRSSYTATASFGDILSRYEDLYRKKEEVKKKENISKEDARSRVNDALRTSTMFLEESGDEKMAENVSWSVLGGKNPSYVRPQEKKEEKKDEKKSFRRSSAAYTASVSFSDILSEYENGKKKKTEEEKKAETVKEEVKAEEPDFFIRDDEEKVPDNVSWSILGGRNENFVRKEEVKTEEEKREPEEKRPGSVYTPKKDFGEILSSYSEKKAQEKEKNKEEKSEKTEEEVKVKEPDFFIRDEEETVPSNVSWSILGGRNENFVRPAGEKTDEKQQEERKEKKEKRVSEAYSPTKPFSSILSSYEKKSDKPREKTFSEIMQEKGDGKKRKSTFTINELRRMNVQATLDLHGETQKESSEMILSFLNECTSSGLRKVSVITGKGLHSESGTGVLRDVALSVLSSSPYVQEISPAPLSKGGSGAVWVILKERTDE